MAVSWSGNLDFLRNLVNTCNVPSCPSLHCSWSWPHTAGQLLLCPFLHMRDCLCDFRQPTAGLPADKSWSRDWLIGPSTHPFVPHIVILKMARKGTCETIVFLEIPNKDENRGSLNSFKREMTSCLALRQSKGICFSILKPTLIGLLWLICSRQKVKIIENVIIMISILAPKGSYWILTTCQALRHSGWIIISHAPCPPRNSHFNAARCRLVNKSL